MQTLAELKVVLPALRYVFIHCSRDDYLTVDPEEFIPQEVVAMGEVRTALRLVAVGKDSFVRETEFDDWRWIPVETVRGIQRRVTNAVL